MTATLNRPQGLGTSAFRLFTPKPESKIYCPPPVRDDPALGEEVNDRLVDWAAEVGIYPGHAEGLRECGFGRLIMLAHPGTSDPDRLLAVAKVGLALWSTDDHLLDEEQLGADPQRLGSRLTIVAGAVDPAHLPVAYAPELERTLRAEPVAMAYRGALEHYAKYATNSQLARVRHETITMFMAYNQEAEWIRTGRRPAVWEYLTHRHFNGFLPCIVSVDMAAGYELSPHDYADPRVRRVFTMAGSAAVLANDLYSRGRESDTDNDLPKAVAREDGVGEDVAVRRSIDLHNELMHTIEAEAAALSSFGSPQLRRAMADVWAWLGGGHEWHATSRRYHSDTKGDKQ